MNTLFDRPPQLSGEQLVRRQAGLDRPGYSGPTKSRRIPAVAAEFLSAQPMLAIGAADPQGRLWASLLTGPPGFLAALPGAAENPDGLRVDALPSPSDPLAAVLRRPTPVGMIALEPSKRRRMRMNGRAAADGSGLTVTLDQVFANCPKYIQSRAYELREQAPGTPIRTTELTGSQAELISASDTFFITTADRSGDVDTSHRGGNPGFVQLLAPDRLRWPDYVGNAMFCTLGNLAENPAAGLLFIDWRTGTTLQLTGTAHTDWNPAHAAQVPGAQRLVDFTLHEALTTPTALPLHWTAPDYSRFNPPL